MKRVYQDDVPHPLQPNEQRSLLSSNDSFSDYLQQATHMKAMRLQMDQSISSVGSDHQLVGAKLHPIGKTER